MPYRRAVESDRLSARFWYNLASSDRKPWRLAEAELVATARSNWTPSVPQLSLRSELRTQTADVNHVVELRVAHRCQPSGQRARVALGYALAKELDDLALRRGVSVPFRSSADPATAAFPTM